MRRPPSAERGPVAGAPSKEIAPTDPATNDSAPPRGPAAHKAAAKALGIKGNAGGQLIVLQPNNDPFYKGTDAHWRDARWFTEIWDRFGYANGVHLRRVHYQVLSEGLEFADGTPYENTENMWSRLCGAGAAARILGLVDVEAFDDRRNPDPVINRPARQWLLEPPGVHFERASVRLPDLDLEELGQVEFEVPRSVAYGYSYDPDDQPVVLELWIEKSTMGDVLEPVCRRNHVNYVPGLGFESITQTVRLLRRADRYGKPMRILYVSDFDPGGEGMPVAVARQVQFWMGTLGITVPITVDHIALTRDQCVEFELPRTPIKGTDRRRGGFEARHGEGATELDALEALHPGSLAEIVSHAIAPFVDQGLRRRLAAAAREAQERIDAAWTDAAGQELEQAARELSAEASAVGAEQANRIREMVEEALGELDQFTERGEELARRARGIAETLHIELPERPQSDVAVEASDSLLFDSRRHWLDQLAVFKARQNGHGNGATP
jgi:hypothetical protein